MIRLGDFATAPLYNIKAVVQATTISPSTLRAWERRYEFCTPHRSESGYRLYSDQDIAVIRWLKLQVDSGMAISQAVTWYQGLVSESKTLEQIVLPVPNHIPAAGHSTIGKPRSFEILRNELTNALIAYQDAEADQIWTEAAGYYTIEELGEQLIKPILVEIGTRWHEGQISIAREHYATNYVRQHLLSILRASRQNPSGRTIWVGCAPQEQHEIGAILLAVYLKRAGFRVTYLGQNLPLEELSVDIESERPAMIVLSASMLDSARQLVLLTDEIAALNVPKLFVGYGGRIFNAEPELREKIAGIYLGESSLEAVDTIESLFAHEAHYS